MSVGKMTDFKILLNKYKKTQTELSKEFSIPLRTVQNWCEGKRNCPSYVMSLIEFKLEYEKYIHRVDLVIQ